MSSDSLGEYPPRYTLADAHYRIAQLEEQLAGLERLLERYSNALHAANTALTVLGAPKKEVGE